MITQEQAAEIERKGSLNINLNLFHGMRSTAVELHLLSLGPAGGFPVHCWIHL